MVESSCLQSARSSGTQKRVFSQPSLQDDDGMMVKAHNDMAALLTTEMPAKSSRKGKEMQGLLRVLHWLPRLSEA